MSQIEVTILDGGMGKHLERSGAPFRQPEWSALALLETPDLVQAAHEAFIAVGADVITSNSYAVVPFHIGEDRFAERGSELVDLAGRLARAAADGADRPIQVRGSLPPLFGSYEPWLFDADRAPGLLDVLVGSQAEYVDGWISETTSSIAEALAALDAVERHRADHPDAPGDVWVSFTVPEELPEGGEITLRSGESIADAVAAIADRATAVLFNCSPPEMVDLAVATARAAIDGGGHDLRLGAYANAFEPKPEEYSANSVSLGGRDEITPARYREIAEGWAQHGATIVGGCCMIHTEHIDELGALKHVH